MAIVKLYLHVCKQAAACQKTLVTELLPLLSLKKPDFEKPFSDSPAPHLLTSLGSLEGWMSSVARCAGMLSATSCSDASAVPGWGTGAGQGWRPWSCLLPPPHPGHCTRK